MSQSKPRHSHSSQTTGGLSPWQRYTLYCLVDGYTTATNMPLKLVVMTARWQGLPSASLEREHTSARCQDSCFPADDAPPAAGLCGAPDGRGAVSMSESSWLVMELPSAFIPALAAVIAAATEAATEAFRSFWSAWRPEEQKGGRSWNEGS